MAYITITGDSDGDLHTAAMHNSKFGAIASVINGNIGKENLINPNAELVFTFSAKHVLATVLGIGATTGINPAATALSNLSGYSSLGATNTGAPTSGTPDTAADRWNMVTNSVVRVPATMTLKDNVTIVVDNELTAAGFSGLTLTFQLQKSNNPSNLTAWTDVGSAATHSPHGGGTYSQTILTLSNTTGQSITADHYLRLVVKNASGTTPLPPTLVATVRLSAPHIN
tara:strand:+ start:554 stop:1234 length:681 start_codon:yes stop_codon:yes gene_type:complete